MTWNNNAFAADQAKLLQGVYDSLAAVADKAVHPEVDDKTREEIKKTMGKVAEVMKGAGKEGLVAFAEGAAYGLLPGGKEAVIAVTGLLDARKQLQAHCAGPHNQEPPAAGTEVFKTLGKILAARALVLRVRQLLARPFSVFWALWLLVTLAPVNL